MDLVVKGGLLDRDHAERLRAGAAFLNLEVSRVPFLVNLEPKQFEDLRTSDEYRFKDFRKKWTKVCDDLKKSPWEPGFEKEANQLWDQVVMPEAERV